MRDLHPPPDQLTLLLLIEKYSTRSETKAAFAERTIRSIKNLLYRYMEDYGYRYIQKLPHLNVTMNSRNSRSNGMKPNNDRKSDFLSQLHSKPLRAYKKPKFGIGDRVRFSNYDLHFRKSYQPQFTQETFEIVSIATKKTSNIHNQRRTAWRYTWEILLDGNDWSQLSMSSFTIELVSNASSQLFPNNTLSSITNFLPGQENLDAQW